MRTSLHSALLLSGLLLLQASMAGAPFYEPPAKAEQPTTNSATEAWIKWIEQGLAPAAPTVNPQDAVVLLSALKARIDQVLKEGNTHPAFGKEIPGTIDDFEKLFWKMHVFSNQLTSAGRFYDYAQSIKPIARKYKFQKNDKIDVTGLNANWNWAKIELGELRQRFAQQDRDLRVARLTLADKVLSENNDVAERLLAALQLDMDGEVLPPLLAKDKTYPATLLQKVNDTIQHARAAAGPEFLQKARWLFTGLHWWVRGRYGAGTAGGGLLKDQAALNSADAMFGLMMPINTPNPTPPSANDPVPYVDRRHHYLWQFETRQVASAYSKTTTTDVKFTPTWRSVTTLTHFY